MESSFEIFESKNSTNSGISQALPDSIPIELENATNTYLSMITPNASRIIPIQEAGILMNYALGIRPETPKEACKQTQLTEPEVESIHDCPSSEACITKELWEAIEHVADESTCIESLDSRLFIESNALASATHHQGLNRLNTHLERNDQYPDVSNMLSSLLEQRKIGNLERTLHHRAPVSNSHPTSFARFNNFHHGESGDDNQYITHQSSFHRMPLIHASSTDPTFTDITDSSHSPIRLNFSQYAYSNHDMLNSGDYGGSFGTQGSNYSILELCEQIWRYGDQKASLFLQERVKTRTPGEYESLVKIIHDQSSILMVHRFGNFLVQSMLETAEPNDIERFTLNIIGKVAYFSVNQFCCHVIQKLLDVGPIVVQARIASELLDHVYTTMTSPFGTHVWQKLLQLPWPKQLPPLATMTHNAVRIQVPENGWVSIAKTESGCSSVRSYLCLNQKDCADCANDLLYGLHELMTCDINTSPVVSKLALLSSTRARTMTQIFSRAYEYSRHPIGSHVLVHLLQLKIPSFPTRFSSAISTYRSRMEDNEHTIAVMEALNRAQGANGKAN